MGLNESSMSPATGSRRGSSGFIKPKSYTKHRTWLGDVCDRTTGYTLTDYADGLEKLITANDFRVLYKHFYYEDPEGNLEDRIKDIKDKEPPSELNKPIKIGELILVIDLLLRMLYCIHNGRDGR